MMISVISVDTIAFPSLMTARCRVDAVLERWQAWSDKTFGGEYRDAVETLLYGLVLLVCCTAVRVYDRSKRCLGEALGYWLAEAHQHFVAERGLWMCYQLLPVIHTCDDCWDALEATTAVAQEILDYELGWAVAAELLR